MTKICSTLIKLLAPAIILLGCLCLSAADPVKTDTPAASSETCTKPDDVNARKLSDEELDVLLANMEKELGTIKSLKTAFIQEKHLSIFSDVIKAKGLCLFKAPDLVRFEINEPFHSVFIAQHKKVAKYELLRDKWQKLDIPGRDRILMVTKQIAAWLQGKFRDQNGIYNISATVGQDTIVILTPKDKRFRENISAIELTLAENKKHISSVNLLEPGGDFTIMKFFDQQRDIELSDEIFDTSGSTPTKIEPGRTNTDSPVDDGSKSPSADGDSK